MKRTEKRKKRVFSDSGIMFKRCMITSLRNPEAFITALLLPAIMMWFFGSVFGSAMDVGAYNYIDFIVPGIILQVVAQGTQATAINVNNDMTKGIMDRFRSMAITKSSVLTGHVFSSVIRSIITTAISIGIAIAIGFRPQAGFSDWLIISGILILFIFAITWIAVLCGLVAKDAASAGPMMVLLLLLPFVSSGFVPTETMSRGLRAFAENQPMTPIIDSLRALMLNNPTGDALPIALIWCIGMIVVAFVVSMQVYKRKLS